MLTQLSTVKTRLVLTVTDFDGILTSAIKAVSARFDKEANRTLVRTPNVTASRRPLRIVNSREFLSDFRQQRHFTSELK